jgi:hypothetical protein
MATQTLREIIAESAAADRLSEKGVATFNVGDRCIHRRTGTEMVITQGYQRHWILDPNGDIIDKDNARVSCRFGYITQDNFKGTVAFYPAASLLDLNNRKRHIQLVWPPKPEPIKAKKTRTARPRLGSREGR